MQNGQTFDCQERVRKGSSPEFGIIIAALSQVRGARVRGVARGHPAFALFCPFIHAFPILKFCAQSVPSCMRDVGTGQRRLREDAASADAKARMEDGGWKMEAAGAAFWAKSMMLTERSGEKSPAHSIAHIPLTFIPLTFPLSFRFSPALNGWRHFRDNLR